LPSQKKSSAILSELRSLGSEGAREGMARFGINSIKAYGVSLPELRSLAKDIGVDHELALELWKSGVHEARILASLIDDPSMVSGEQMDEWVSEFDSWDVCDQCCGNLFDKTRFAQAKAIEYSAREEEFVKRAGFALMAWTAVHNKTAGNKEFLTFLPIIKREAGDDRNFVKKSVNWALRQIGKRNIVLNHAAIKTAREISTLGSKSATWIAADALKELNSKAVATKLSKKKN
jgi:3-methyladenine DNA glycosylase AlkD